MEANVQHEARSMAMKQGGRMRSLDVLRGLVIAAMLLVNVTWNEAIFPAQMFHVPWNDPKQGVTLTDLVFPWFLFIAGAAIPLSMRSGRGQGMGALGRILLAARRGLVIYMLGVLLTVAGTAHQQPIRWTDLLSWNILQLIGVGYFVAVCVYQLPRTAQIGMVVAVIAGKWMTLTLLPWEMVGPLFEPRVAEGGPLGAGTFAHFDAVKRAIHCEHLSGPGWALVGWLGMAQQFLPCAAIAIMGGWTCELLSRVDQRLARRAIRVLSLGVGLTLLGLVLQWRYQPQGGGLLGLWTVPMSKWLFSPAYCLFAAGTGALVFAAVYVVVDGLGWLRMWWAEVMGLNAIALYVGAELTYKVVWTKWLVSTPDGGRDHLMGGSMKWLQEWLGPVSGGWAHAIGYLVLWWVLMWLLYRRRIFLKI